MLKDYELKLMEAFDVSKINCEAYNTKCDVLFKICDGCLFHTEEPQYPKQITELQWLRMFACYMNWFNGEAFCDVELDPYELDEDNLEEFVQALIDCPKPKNFVKEIKYILMDRMDLYKENK